MPLRSGVCVLTRPPSRSGPAAGWPKLLWFVTESKHLSKPPRDWFPHIKDANNDTAYIEVSPVSWQPGGPGRPPSLTRTLCVSVQNL